jgi:transcriptional regulator with XRE-family HTH domain
MDMQQTSSTVEAQQGKMILSLAQRLALGSRLTELREAKGLTQLQVARKALGFTVSHAAVSRLERGVFGSVEEDRLHSLASFYETSVEELLAEIEGRQEAVEPAEYLPVDALVVQPGVAARLFNLRQTAGLTAPQMAAALGYKECSTIIRQWEKGEVTPRPDTLLDIAYKFGVSAAWLISGRRAKPQAPTFAMRLRAMQKLYDLSNRDVALLAKSDMERGLVEVHQLGRARRQPSAAQVTKLAQALDVPADWLCPPTQSFEASQQRAEPFTEVTGQAGRFLRELHELFSSEALTDKDVAWARKHLMDALMQRHGKVTYQKPGVRNKVAVDLPRAH